MKLIPYQSSDLCIEDLKTREDVGLFLRNSCVWLNRAIKAAQAEHPGGRIEVGFFVICDKERNPRGENGFWDVSVAVDDGIAGQSIMPPTVIEVKQRLETRQVVVWE